MMIFVGQELEHELDTGLDLDGFATLQIRYTKPDAVSTTNLTATRVGGTRKIVHILTPTELDTAGLWKANGWIVYGSGKVVPTETVEFMVYNLGDSP